MKVPSHDTTAMIVGIMLLLLSVTVFALTLAPFTPAIVLWPLLVPANALLTRTKTSRIVSAIALLFNAITLFTLPGTVLSFPLWMAAFYIAWRLAGVPSRCGRAGERKANSLHTCGAKSAHFVGNFF